MNSALCATQSLISCSVSEYGLSRLGCLTKDTDVGLTFSDIICTNSCRIATTSNYITSIMTLILILIEMLRGQHYLCWRGHCFVCHRHLVHAGAKASVAQKQCKLECRMTSAFVVTSNKSNQAGGNSEVGDAAL